MEPPSLLSNWSSPARSKAPLAGEHALANCRGHVVGVHGFQGEPVAAAGARRRPASRAGAGRVVRRRCGAARSPRSAGKMKARRILVNDDVRVRLLELFQQSVHVRLLRCARSLPTCRWWSVVLYRVEVLMRRGCSHRGGGDDVAHAATPCYLQQASGADDVVRQVLSGFVRRGKAEARCTTGSALSSRSSKVVAAQILRLPLPVLVRCPGPGAAGPAWRWRLRRPEALFVAQCTKHAGADVAGRSCDDDAHQAGGLVEELEQVVRRLSTSSCFTSVPR